jgi:hypothetical protein
LPRQMAAGVSLGGGLRAPFNAASGFNLDTG